MLNTELAKLHEQLKVRIAKLERVNKIRPQRTIENLIHFYKGFLAALRWQDGA